MQRRHPVRHLVWRGGVAVVAQAMMFTGVYPLLPHAVRALARKYKSAEGRSGAGGGAKVDDARFAKELRTAVAEWGMAALVSAARPAGFFPLPGAKNQGPRPIIVLHGYAMNRANFTVLAVRLRKAGLGPVYGFEYWTLGRVAAGARQLGWFVDEVREATGAATVDVIGHSMGGVVGRYYVQLAGGDAYVNRLVTLGSPHSGTDVSRVGIGHPTRELVLGSKLMARLAAAPPPQQTKVTVIWSNSDALVPGARQLAFPGAEVICYDDIGHVALLGSRRVAREIIARLSG